MICRQWSVFWHNISGIAVLPSQEAPAMKKKDWAYDYQRLYSASFLPVENLAVSQSALP